MRSRRFSNKPPADLCSEWTADDGIDPRLQPRGAGAKVSNRKSLQLCRQVEHAMCFALEGELLRDLSVKSVVPAPDSSRLLVTLVFHGLDSVTTPEILASLHGCYAKLRAEIAASIHRKKTPELTFHVIKSEPEA
ncbi:MAG: ribosome-binding factor A [Gemmataceae bacterium]|nr:ribosome-binding factor A [Gemmataceae bacterium]